MTVHKQNNSAWNDGQLAPGNPFPERGTNTVDRILAENQRRAGGLYAEEGLGLEAQNVASFRGGRRDLAGIYDTKLADGARVPSSPTWDAVPPAVTQALAAGLGDTQRGSGPMTHSPRAGANHAALAPMDGFSGGERSTPREYESKIASNPRRRSAADVSDMRF